MAVPMSRRNRGKRRHSRSETIMLPIAAYNVDIMNTIGLERKLRGLAPGTASPGATEAAWVRSTGAAISGVRGTSNRGREASRRTRDREHMVHLQKTIARGGAAWLRG